MFLAGLESSHCHIKCITLLSRIRLQVLRAWIKFNPYFWKFHINSHLNRRRWVVIVTVDRFIANYESPFPSCIVLIGGFSGVSSIDLGIRTWFDNTTSSLRKFESCSSSTGFRLSWTKYLPCVLFSSLDLVECSESQFVVDGGIIGSPTWLGF